MANWIKGAIKHPGAFTAKAKAKGEGVQEYASEVISKSKKKPEGEKGGTLLRQALLARTLKRMHGGK